MKKTFAKLIIIFSIFLIAFPGNFSLATEESNAPTGSADTKTQQIKEMTDEEWKDLKTTNAVEQVFTEFFLSFGDYAHDYLSQVFKEDITIDGIVFNKVTMLNANFFDKSVNPAISSASGIIKETINKWFEIFQTIALVCIMACIVAVGIKILWGSASGKVKAFELLKKVVMAVILIFFFPYVMRYAFDLNEAIVQSIYSSTHQTDEVLGSTISQASDLMIDELEFRSPQYVSASGLRLNAGSKEATQLYISKLEKYMASADVMRIMRAFAGVTLRLVFVVIWFIMLGQTYILTFIYIKRYLTIAFLTAIYPLVVVGYVTGAIKGDKNTSFNGWCGKYFSNIFLQTLHAIIYGVISGVLIGHVRDAMITDIDKINWILVIVATSFLFTGEKILFRFWKAATDTADRKAVKGLLGVPKKVFGFIGGK